MILELRSEGKGEELFKSDFGICKGRVVEAKLIYEPKGEKADPNGQRKETS